MVAPTLWQVYSHLWDNLLDHYGLSPEDFDRTHPQNEIMEWCTVNQVPCLNLLPVLESHAEADELLYYSRDQHWTAQGNRRVGEAISDWLSGILQ